MKNTALTTLFLFLVTISCMSQTIKNLEMESRNFESGYYYKDINNKLNPFVGVWRYTNGNTLLEIHIQKRENYFFTSFNYSADVLLGEVKYIENGVLKIDRLQNFNANNFVGSDHVNSLEGKFIMPNTTSPYCVECSPFYKRVRITFHDFLEPTLFFNCFIGLTDEPGNNQLVFKIHKATSPIPDDGLPHDQTIPSGKYILTKIP
jgi:hypothetical protein